MQFTRIALPVAVAALSCVPAIAQHAQVSSVAVDPNSADSVWVCNRDNESVSVIDVVGGVATHQITVGVNPRSLAFSADGSTVFVANQRGNVAKNVNFVTPFTGTEMRGTVTVIDVATKTVTGTLPLVGTEPYGLAVAPNGNWFAVTGFRSNTVKFFDTATLTEVLEHKYLADMNVIPAPFTIADVDANRDGIADVGEPRGFVIRSDSARMYVTHNISPFISVLDLTLDGMGLPTAISETRINTDQYAFSTIFNPTPVQTIASQGVPRFGEDIALSPDGTRALVPALLHNVNHDVNFAFPGMLPGDFANRVYPTLSVIDAVANSYAQPGDSSSRLHDELTTNNLFAEYVPVGDPTPTGTGFATAGGIKDSPVVGGKVRIKVGGLPPGWTAIVHLGRPKNIPMGSMGTLLVNPRFSKPVGMNGIARFNITNNQNLNGVVARAQAQFFDPMGTPRFYTNGVDVVIGNQGYDTDTMGRRAGHPSRVVYNTSGSRVLMLNRGSEDLFMYETSNGGSSLTLRSTFPPRFNFTERGALDTSSPMGDVPLGMVVVDDPTTDNDDARVFVINEMTRTLSVVRVDWANSTMFEEHSQISTLLNPDKMTVSERIGAELFEDASRGQTTGAPDTVGGFNNSCASCHFEGGADGNVWQRPAGPRSTMPVYGGTLGTGLILWKGVRLNMGETGPMFGGENGGHGALSDAEQQGLVDYHETIPFPLNPNLDPVTGQYSALAALGKDLFFGTDDTGLNPTGRNAGCFECHDDNDNPAIGGAGNPRFYTVDFVNPILSGGENLQSFDPTCLPLQENQINTNIRNINSGVNVDVNNDGIPDLDRNFDGFRDLETYTPMNVDTDDDFTRDDPNSWQCPQGGMMGNPPTLFTRDERKFSIPTKLGVFSTPPYFHDHSAFNLRAILDPEAQILNAVYGSPAYSGVGQPGLKKFYNEFHDVRGHEKFVPNASKVQLNLQSVDVDADIEALLAYISSL